MTRNEVFNRIVHLLSSHYGEREANSIARIYIEDIYDIHLPDEDEVNIHIRQLISGFPVQYLAGRVYFYDRFFKVTRDTLIPRPETEEWMHHIIQSQSNKSGLRILDVGTGSGCIAITLYRHLLQADITAIDISEGALMVAEENAGRHNSRIHFIKMDFIDEAQRETLPHFDLIVSNPPYVGDDEEDLMGRGVSTYEPGIALFAGSDPLIFYKALALFGLTHLKPGGLIYAEINEYKMEETLKIFIEMNYRAEVLTDIQGKPRVIEAELTLY
ncbi:MAG TPA: peptide chain release factor N(5)-glutamine methyltransferase [Saprospiraceae bacterium]|nr:peptide chain release factor N(5)-glutamine methyltransferase [Saprospiraceae bacterium]